LSRGLINRHLFKVEVTSSPISKERKEELLSRICNQLYINRKEANYFLSISSIENDMYKKEDDSIEIIYNDGSTKDIAEASDMLNISLLSRKVKKYYVCYLRPEEGGH
jgi:lipopolysaccharide export LptBFGC system permease protein LptF